MHEGRASIGLTDIIQVIGAAYTFRPSLAVRHHLTREISAHHSAQSSDFSYFYKGDNRSMVGGSQQLYLRTDPLTGRLATHWPEPELAILLGKQHEIIAFTLANDLTAISLEKRGRTTLVDSTYIAKVWHGSGSLGPIFVAAKNIDVSNVNIGLRIERGGAIIYDHAYNTARSLRSILGIPDQIVGCHGTFGSSRPPSKEIALDDAGFLVPGTVVMLGTGLIVSKRYSCRPGDRVTVYSAEFGELINPVNTAVGSD